jgi:hypothetical protein
VGGRLWRTTDDIANAWDSMSDIGFGQVENAQHDAFTLTLLTNQEAPVIDQDRLGQQAATDNALWRIR